MLTDDFIVGCVFIGGVLFAAAMVWCCCAVIVGKVHDSEDRRGHDD
jgi:hypothetical protein